MKEYNLFFSPKLKGNSKKLSDYILISDAVTESEVKYSLSSVFEESHRLTSDFVKKDYKKKIGYRYDPMSIALYKVYCGAQILPICQLLLVAKKILNSEKCTVNIKVNNIYTAKSISNILGIDKNISICNEGFEIKKIVAFIKSILRIFIYIYNGFFVKKDGGVKKVLICFGSDRFIAPFFSDESIVYPLYNSNDKFSKDMYSNKVVRRKFISLSCLIKNIPAAVKLFKQGLKISNSYFDVLHQTIYIMTEVLLCSSLNSKYKNIKYLIGTFDASSCIDAITWFVNRQCVKTIITPHGMPFSFKYQHLSYGANVYCTWSELHSRILIRNKFLQESCKVKVAGNPIYEKMNKHYSDNQKNNSTEYSVLLIMENISDDFCRSLPYQSVYYEQLISTVVELCRPYSDVSITVRTRNKDKVYYVARKFIDNITISTQLDVKIETDINRSDIIITQYSNAINEALIFDKRVIQVDLYSIKDWHTEINNKNIEKVNSIKSLKITLLNRIKNRIKKNPYFACDDEYNFYKCQHRPYKTGE